MSMPKWMREMYFADETKAEIAKTEPAIAPSQAPASDQQQPTTPAPAPAEPTADSQEQTEPKNESEPAPTPEPLPADQQPDVPAEPWIEPVGVVAEKPVEKTTVKADSGSTIAKAIKRGRPAKAKNDSKAKK